MQWSENALEALKPKVAPPVIGYLVTILLAASTLYKYFLPVELPWYIMQLSFIAVIGLTACWVITSGELAYCHTAISVTLIMMVPYIFVLAQSIVLWVINRADTAYMRQGIVSISYQLLILIMVGCACILLGSKASYYVCLGLVIGNLLIVAGAFAKYGVGNCISELISFFMSFGADDNTTSMALEIHDLTFALGEILIFLMMFRKGRKKWIAFIIVGIFFLLGWKRSAIPGILVGCLYIFFMRKKSKDKILRFTLIVGIIMILAAFAYITLVYTGLLEYLTDKLNIDMMGRNQLYDWIKDHYWLSPTYAGYGHGYITVIMREAYLTGTQVLNDELTIHSDVLARYIELGFIGNLVWSYLQSIWVFRMITKKYSTEAGLIYFACYIFSFLTYFTDNTMFYYFINIVIHLLPLSIIFKEKEEALDTIIRKAGMLC